MRQGVAWVAGLFDGEGCIHINRQRCTRRSELKTDGFRLFVQITLGHLPTLRRVQRIMGCGTVQPHTVSKRHANKAWCWMTSAGDAKRVLAELLPYLFTKVSEARIGIAFGRLKPWQPGGLGGATVKPVALIRKQQRYYWMLRFAKSRWRFYRRKLKQTDRREIRALGLAVKAGFTS